MKYSIIVPAYNSAGFVSKCLESVRQQTFTDYELIVVCDRCTDNTAEIVGRYADKILTADYGNDGCRQVGLDAADGDWILFLDDDDHWIHEYVLEIIDNSLSDDIDILCYGFIFRGRGYAKPIRRIDGRNIFWPAVWNKCYRRAFIGDIRFNSIVPHGNVAADIDWTSRLISQPFRYSILDQPLYYYDYMRQGSQTDGLAKTNVKICKNR